MKFRFFPKDEKFFALFREDADNLKVGVEALQDLIDHYEDVEKKFQKIKSIEHQGDIITHDIITKLRETFITPLEREDIHELASGLDDVLDCVEGVASRLFNFKVQRPTPEMKQLVDIINQSVSQIHEAIIHLEKMGHVHSFCMEVNNLEYQADLIGQQGHRRPVRENPAGRRPQGADQAQGDLRTPRRSPPTAARTWPTSSRASASRPT